MNEPAPISEQLQQVLTPTMGQAVISLVLSAVWLVLTHAVGILLLIGAPAAVLGAAQLVATGQLKDVVSLPIVSNVALITFWATIGLVVYLLSWAAFNVLIQARNEVTLTTAYTNRGHWRSPLATLGLKLGCAVALLAMVALIRPGAGLWFGWFDGWLTTPSAGSALLAVAAVIGFAAQGYLTYMAGLLTFSPWYRTEAFTDEQS